MGANVPPLNEPVERVILDDSDEKRKHHLKHELELFSNRPSLLSSEAAVNSYRGLLNLMIILLILTNFRLIVENLLKHGWLMNTKMYYIEDVYRWPAVIIGLVLCTFVIVSYLLELCIFRGKIADELGIKLIIANIVLAIGVPSTLVWIIKPNPASGLVVMLFVASWGMKLTSYAHVNYDLRKEARKEKVDNGWPNNITLSNLLYFIAIPTLVYRLEYPRTDSIRWGWLLRRAVEGILLCVLILIMVEQYVIPVVHSSMKPMDSYDIWGFVERLLKLAIPNLYIWLLGFYVFFHIYLNIIAELTKYGDRLFYRDWWNSTSLGYYWRTWNIPVHAWMLVHVYTPLIKSGRSKLTAYVACFLVSAIFHELVIAVPFQIVKLWSFFGMMAQMPLIQLTASLRGNQAGNVIFWFSIVLGQPFLVLMMYRSWTQKHFGDDSTPAELVIL